MTTPTDTGSDERRSRMYIGGRWRDASDGGVISVSDPATLLDVGPMARATASDLDDALAASAEGFEVWRNTSAWDRSDVLRQMATILRAAAPEMSRTLTTEQGKPLAESRAEVAGAADQFDWYADEARRIYGRLVDGHSRSQRLMVHKYPVGPVAAFVPWNFPILLAARKIAPALAAGCSVIVKAPSEAPHALLGIAEAAERAGLPAGVLNIVAGDATMIASHLVTSDTIRKVTLTGSVTAARAILRLCAEVAKPATMELGGNAPAIVFADADLAKAVDTCVRAKFRNAGQICVAPNSFLVDDAIYGAFVEQFTERTRGLVMGNGLDPAVEVGPLVNARRLAETDALVEEAVGAGARVVLGGARTDRVGPGHFYEPTVLTDATLEMRVVADEIFGPVAPIVRVPDVGRAILDANAINRGLVAYIFTSDPRIVFRAIDELDCGMVGVNNLVIATAEAPFGGTRMAGYGRENGPEGIESYLTTKYVNWIP